MLLFSFSEPWKGKLEASSSLPPPSRFAAAPPSNNTTKTHNKNKNTHMEPTKNNMSLKLAALAGLSLILAGCASIVSGTKQSIKISSTPDVADVKVERLTLQQNLVEFEGKTPT